MDEIKGKIQMALQSRPLGAINVSDLPRCYKRIHNEKLDCKAFGFENLNDLLETMSDVVQVSLDRKSSEYRVFLVNYEVEEAMKKEQFLPKDSFATQTKFKVGDKKCESEQQYRSRYDERDMTKEKKVNHLRDKPIPTKFRDNNDWELYLTNFPKDFTESDLMEIFKTFGCTKIRIKKKDDKSFGFAAFKTYAEAEEAYVTLDGTFFQGRRLIIQFARSSIAPEEEVMRRLEKTQFSSEIKSSRRKLEGFSESTVHSVHEMTEQSSRTLNSERNHEVRRVGYANAAESFSPHQTTSMRRSESSPSAADNMRTKELRDLPINQKHREISSEIILNDGSECLFADTNQFNSSDSGPCNHPDQCEIRRHTETGSNVLSSTFFNITKHDDTQRNKSNSSESCYQNLDASTLPPSSSDREQSPSAPSRCVQTVSHAALSSNELNDIEFRVCTKQVIYIRDNSLLQTRVNRAWSKRNFSIFDMREHGQIELLSIDKTRVKSLNASPVNERQSTLSLAADVLTATSKTDKTEQSLCSCCDRMPDSMRFDLLQGMLKDTQLHEGYLQHHDLPKVLDILVIHVCDANHFWGSIISSEKLREDYVKLIKMMSEAAEKAKPEFQLDRATTREKRVGVFYENQDLCRAWIKSRIDATRADVFYIDYGNSERLLTDRLFVLPRKCWQLRPLALPFHLSGVLNNGELEDYTNERLSLQLVSPQPQNTGFVLSVESLQEEVLWSPNSVE